MHLEHAVLLPRRREDGVLRLPDKRKLQRAAPHLGRRRRRRVGLVRHLGSGGHGGLRRLGGVGVGDAHCRGGGHVLGVGQVVVQRGEGLVVRELDLVVVVPHLELLLVGAVLGAHAQLVLALEPADLGQPCELLLEQVHILLWQRGRRQPPLPLLGLGRLLQEGALLARGGWRCLRDCRQVGQRCRDGLGLLEALVGFGQVHQTDL
mmetsp:Transcript_10607/g.24343  ORF Transcript_10607/g.24343 Transcript_10607/m.24343 type:complete len:206 (-) Transcript_10607:112-729(-)